MTKENKITIKIMIISLIVMIVGLLISLFFNVMQCRRSYPLRPPIQHNPNVKLNADYRHNKKTQYEVEIIPGTIFCYRFSEMLYSKDMGYTINLIVELKGHRAMYSPIIYLEFSKVIKKVKPTYENLSQVISKGESNSNEYLFKAKEFSPRCRIEFEFSNDIEFDILKFRIDCE